MRPKIKICGVTTVEDAERAVGLGADFLGLNFHPPSPRFVDRGRAREIAGAVGGRTTLVGVFVNRPAREVDEIARTVGLDKLQFHGDESRREVLPFAERAIKAVRIGERLVPGDLAGWDEVWGLLVDAGHPRLYGGTGRSWDFASLRELAGSHPRIFVAGGLGPDNVRAAVAAARPWGVDLCSGVEGRPGRKDVRLMQRLFEEIEDGESVSAA